jgi:hypothetical protein
VLLLAGAGERGTRSRAWHGAGNRNDSQTPDVPEEMNSSSGQQNQT